MHKDSALFPVIPASTARAARALYGRGNLYLRLGDRLNHLVSKFDPKIISIHMNGDNALFSLFTIIQYVEKLTDVELAESIERRMELRYALHLATPSPRLDPQSLCTFRRRIFTDPQCRSLLDEMSKHVYPELTSVTMKEEPNIDQVLNWICKNEVRALLMEAMLNSMEALSANHFNWLRQIALPHWYQRYNRSLVIAASENSSQKQELLQEDIWGDIQHLLYEIRESNSSDIMEMPETKNLNRVWEQLTDPKSMLECGACINLIH
jgi:hypothetical protein